AGVDHMSEIVDRSGQLRERLVDRRAEPGCFIEGIDGPGDRLRRGYLGPPKRLRRPRLRAKAESGPHGHENERHREAGGGRLTTDDWRLTTDDWRLTTDDWRLTTIDRHATPHRST